MTENKVVFLKGKKVILRPLRKETDLEPCLRWFNDPDVTQYLTTYLPIMPQKEAEWFDELAKSNDRVELAIETHDGKFIGTIGLHGIHPRDRTAMSGTVIGEKGDKESNWGRGLGTDAKMQLLHYAFNTLNLRKINSAFYAFNERSLKYCLKCGYKIEGRREQEVFRNGEYQDVILLAVFRDDWLPIWKRYQEMGEAEQ